MGYVRDKIRANTARQQNPFWTEKSKNVFYNTLGEGVKLYHYRGEGGEEWEFEHLTGPRNAYDEPATGSSDKEWKGKTLTRSGFETRQQAVDFLRHTPSITHLILSRDRRGNPINDDGKVVSWKEWPEYTHRYAARMLQNRYFILGRLKNYLD